MGTGSRIATSLAVLTILWTRTNSLCVEEREKRRFPDAFCHQRYPIESKARKDTKRSTCAKVARSFAAIAADTERPLQSRVLVPFVLQSAHHGRGKEENVHQGKCEMDTLKGSGRGASPWKGMLLVNAIASKRAIPTLVGRRYRW